MPERPRTLDYAAAERAELSEEGRSVEEVARQLVGQLEGMPIWGHPRTQINVVPPPSIPSVIGSLLPAIYNPNLVSDDTSYGLMLTEAAVVAMASRLVGYDPARAPWPLCRKRPLKTRWMLIGVAAVFLLAVTPASARAQFNLGHPAGSSRCDLLGPERVARPE